MALSISDSTMQILAGVTTLMVAVAVVSPIVLFTGHASDDDQGPNIDDMTAIEASIAYRKTPQPKQPQKDKTVEPTVKPEGVSHDDQKKPDPPKPDVKHDDKPPTLDDLGKFHHASDPSDTGKPVQDVGAFDGSERGFGDETKGDPFFGQLSADLHNNWEYPQILNASGTPVGCVHLTAEGKVADIKLWEKSGNDSFDDSVEHALKKVQKAREDAPVVVPSYLLPKITKWICFRFNPPSAAPAAP